MGKDEKALHRLWREKRGEAAALDLSSVLIVQLGFVTEDLNRRWYEQNSGHKETGAVFQAKFMLPWSFSEEAGAEKHIALTQHAGRRRQEIGALDHQWRWQVG